jgi:serine/threonine-protein kinase
VTTEATTGAVTPADAESPLAWGPGTLVGRFLVIGKLGAGGMGEVWSAYDPTLDRKVAIKLLKRHDLPAADAQREARLLREAQALARLTHPNVIAVHDVGAVGARVFVAMELVDGETLGQWLSRRPSRRAIVNAFLQAGRGLAAAHHARLVHRDFKPANVLVAADGRVLVTDFGVAGLAARDAADEPAPPGALGEPLTREGTLIGTPGYMAPEILAREPVDARADQFSFAASLYHALAGTSAGALDLGRAVLDGRPRPVPRSVPGWLRAAVERGLSRDPAARFPDMGALLAVLARGPRVTARRAAVAAFAVAALAAAAVAAARPRASPPCTGMDARLAGVWDEARKREVHAAFLATGNAHGDDTFARIARALDDYAAGWASARTGACAATAIHGEQSAAVLDLRMQCLERRLGALDALVRVLASRPDALAVDRAVEAVSRLPAVADCADAAALAAAVPLPAAPGLRARIAALHAQIDAAAALDYVGQPTLALALAIPVAFAARDVGYSPIAAEALGELMTLRVETVDGAQEATSAEALSAAADAHDDVRAAQALIALLAARDNKSSFADALALRPAIEAAIRRAGDAPGLRSAYFRRLASIDDHTGRYDEGLQAFSDALAAAPPGEIDVARILALRSTTLSKLGRFADARDDAARAADILERALGPDHPSTAVAVTNLANAQLGLHQTKEAERGYRRALAIFQRAYGPESERAALLTNNLAIVVFEDGHYDEAEAMYRRVVALREKLFGPEHPLVAQALWNLGSVLAQKEQLDEAKPVVERALAIEEKAVGPDNPEVRGILDALGEILVDQGRFAAARPIFERSLATAAKHKLPESEHLYSAILGLGLADLGLGRPAAALPELERAQTLASAEHGLRWARAAFGTARALALLGRDRPLARKLAEEARAIYVEDGATSAKRLAQVDAWLTAHR